MNNSEYYSIGWPSSTSKTTIRTLMVGSSLELPFKVEYCTEHFHFLLSQVGGIDEYAICDAIKEKRVTKPVISWVLGTCADMFTSEVV